MASPLRPGVYAPTMTFFDPATEDLDLPTIAKHAVRLARAGLAGLVTLGSNGEAVHLSPEEKAQVTRTTRRALDEAGFTSVPVMAGASSASVRGTLLELHAQAAAGASAALILPPSYYRPAMDIPTVEEYFVAVAEQSPLPIVIYNYPGAVAGIDLDSDAIIRLAKRCPNIVGTKFTCANTGKLARVAKELVAADAKGNAGTWFAFGGIADFAMQTAACGGSGVIAGGANVFPRMCVKVWELWAQGKVEESVKLQAQLAKADWVLTRLAIAGTKAAIQEGYGYGGYPRRPLKRLGPEGERAVKAVVDKFLKLEQSC